MDELEYSKEWLVYAERDFSSAKYLLGHKPVPVEIICFLCQQTAEKCLKGFLVANKITPPKIHDLMELCDMCIAVDEKFKAILVNCLPLTKYAVQPRYPKQMDINDDDLQEAIKNAGVILEFMRPLFA